MHGFGGEVFSDSFLFVFECSLKKKHSIYLKWIIQKGIEPIASGGFAVILMEQERTLALKVPVLLPNFKEHLTDDVYVGEWILKPIMSQIAGHDCVLSHAIQYSHVRVSS